MFSFGRAGASGVSMRFFSRATVSVCGSRITVAALETESFGSVCNPIAGWDEGGRSEMGEGGEGVPASPPVGCRHCLGVCRAADRKRRLEMTSSLQAHME